MRSTASYRDIQDEVLRRILSKEWAPGTLIPAETDLASEFQCARATINRALRELAEQGHLDRKRRAGTRVSDNPVRHATLDIPLIRVEIERLGKAHSHMVLGCRLDAPPVPLIARLGLSAETKLVHVETLHLADREPFVYEDRWINPLAAPGAEKADFSEISANEWLVRNVPISTGDIAFTAEAATKKEAEVFDCVQGTALFIIRRATFICKTPVTDVRLAHRPGHMLKTSI